MRRDKSARDKSAGDGSARRRAVGAGARRKGGGPGGRIASLRAVTAVPIALAAVGLGGWGVTASPIFTAHRIEVVGASHLTRGDVLRAAGVNGSTNVLWTAPSAIESTLETDPWIASASVSRDLPSTMRIRIVERTPASTVMVGATRFLVAGDGTVLGLASRWPRLPVLPTTDRITVGSASRSLAVPASLAGSMTPWLRARVASVATAEDGTVQLALDDGVQVLFGPPTEVEAKDQALIGILRWAARRGARLASIDVRSPIAPAAVPLG